jgi:hypothetical protein
MHKDVATFFAGFIVGFVEGWQLTLGTFLSSLFFPSIVMN